MSFFSIFPMQRGSASPAERNDKYRTRSPAETEDVKRRKEEKPSVSEKIESFTIYFRCYALSLSLIPLDLIRIMLFVSQIFFSLYISCSYCLTLSLSLSLTLYSK